MGAWTDPVFDYLRNNQWVFTEKVDGTNVRVGWDKDAKKVNLGGRTDAAQMPTTLMSKLNDLFPIEKFSGLYGDCSMTLYGEGYGEKIQKGGGNYIKDGQGFVLFDVMIRDMWLERHNIEDIANKLGISTVPDIGSGTPLDAVDLCKNGFRSQWGDFAAEGIVLRPETELKTRRGDRIITKVKCRDFK